MSRRIANLAFAAALGLTVTVGLSGVAQAGPSTVCGNNVVEDPPEKCDDGNQASNDGCSFPSCLPEVCGDNITNPDIGETCDDGGTAPNDGCDANCHLECGNGTIEGAETCDDSGESATCDDDCTAVQCGDGNVNETAGEDCEPPGSATCDAECHAIGNPPTKPQQACINGINGNMLGVLKAQDKAISKCVADVAAGKTDTATCLAGLGAATAKAEAKTTSTESKKCAGDGATTLGHTDPATVNGAAKTESLTSVATVLGVAPNIAPKTDKAGAGCQKEVVKRHFKLLETWAKEANKAKKTAIKSTKTTPGVATDAALAAALDLSIAQSDKIANAENGVNSGISKKCTEAGVDPLFDCNGATTTNELALCVIQAAKRAACLALETSDGLELTCPGDV